MKAVLAPSNPLCPPLSTMESDENSGSYTTEAADRVTQERLERREQLTNDLAVSPYNLILYLERAVIYSHLGYPDLAAGDAYRALLLTDEVRNDGFEYHEQALAALSNYSSAPDALPEVLRHGALSRGSADIVNGHGPQGPGPEQELAAIAAIRCYQVMALSLLLCGCLKSAHEHAQRGLAALPDNQELLTAREHILIVARRRLETDNIDLDDLPEWGVVRREVYPWNTYEPDRFSSQTLAFLNSELAFVAPKCAVKISKLPLLLPDKSSTDGYEYMATGDQLGLFAREDIAPKELVLDEYSVLTANNRHKWSACDACSSDLPPLGAKDGRVSCAGGCDAVFCNQFCHDQAQELYHPAVCDMDVDSIAKDVGPLEHEMALFLLLLARLLAMSAHQDTHPLELKDIKYIWGDFLSTHENAVSLAPDAAPPSKWTLPFSFRYNIQGPLHVLEKMDVDIFQTLTNHDLWVLNTCYAKLRGTASSRKNDIDGRSDVAAVHPLWCLANHDCNPNVSWEWGGRMRLSCKEQRVVGNAPGGIRAGEEILNHYCDIRLPVEERRSWAMPTLGGRCMCQRCRDESSQQETSSEGNGNGNAGTAPSQEDQRMAG